MDIPLANPRPFFLCGRGLLPNLSLKEPVIMISTTLRVEPLGLLFLVDPQDPNKAGTIAQFGQFSS